MCKACVESLTGVGNKFTEWMAHLFTEAFMKDMHDADDEFMTNVFIFEESMAGVKNAVDAAVLENVTDMLIEGALSSFAGGFQQEWA